MSALAAPLDSWPAALGDLHTSDHNTSHAERAQNAPHVIPHQISNNTGNMHLSHDNIQLSNVESPQNGSVNFVFDNQYLSNTTSLSQPQVDGQNFNNTSPDSNTIANNISNTIHSAIAQGNHASQDALSSMQLSFSSPSVSAHSVPRFPPLGQNPSPFPVPPSSARSSAGHHTSALDSQQSCRPSALDISSPLIPQCTNATDGTPSPHPESYPPQNTSQTLSVSSSAPANPVSGQPIESASAQYSAPTSSSGGNGPSSALEPKNEAAPLSSSVPPFVSRLVFTALPPAAPNLTSPSPHTPLTGPPARGFRGSGGTLATKPSPPPTPAASAAARGLRKRARAAARAASCSPLPPPDPFTPTPAASNAAAYPDAVASAHQKNDSTSNTASANLPSASSDTSGIETKAEAMISKQTANNRVVAAMEQAKQNQLDMDAPDLAPLNKRAQRIIRTREAASRNRQEQKAKMLRLKSTNDNLLQSKSALEIEKAKLAAQLEQLRLLVASPLLAQVSETLIAESSSHSLSNSSDFMPDKAASTASSE